MNATPHAPWVGTVEPRRWQREAHPVVMEALPLVFAQRRVPADPATGARIWLALHPDGTAVGLAEAWGCSRLEAAPWLEVALRAREAARARGRASALTVRGGA